MLLSSLSIQVTFILVLFQIMIQSVRTLNKNNEISSTNSKDPFHDPFVWDSNSLYKNSARRRKRSAPQREQPQLVDACQSKMEIITPYYGTNSKGMLRTIVNSESMQQAIQVETCLRSSLNQGTTKCNAQADCGCQQKYKWHRLLVLDPRDSSSSRGLFMDWFLFPSNCVCRCKYSQGSTKQFMKTII